MEFQPFVFETLTTKSMHFGTNGCQSEMDLRDPLRLMLEYTELMMGFLVFKPRPESIAMIGLGGGSIAKYCYWNLPRTLFHAIEINPQVIALRDSFRVPKDAPEFQVILGDGAAFVSDSPRCYDVLIVDGFDDAGLVPSLATDNFYADCFRALNPGGILVANFHQGPDYTSACQRIQKAFEGHALKVPEREGANSIVFASRGRPLNPSDANAFRRPNGFNVECWQGLQSTFDYIRSVHAG